MHQAQSGHVLPSMCIPAQVALGVEKMTYGFRRRGRISLRERMAQNLRALEMQAPPDVVSPGIERIRAHIAALPPKRKRVVRPVDGRPAVPLEKDIQKACLQLLRAHPKVAAVWRQNSGTFTEQNADGSQRYISAHSMTGLPDIVGFLRGGRAVFFEVKRPGGKATPMQQNFIDRANTAGALAAVVTSPEQIEELLR
jgi:hypothetical protein